jgi:serine protease Do
VKQLGVKLVDLTSDLRNRLDLPRDMDGAVVAALAPMGPAARAGLRVGDVITRVQGASVSSADEAKKALGEADLSRGVRLRVRSGDTSRFVLLKVEGD